jgi:hypothetical protein
MVNYCANPNCHKELHYLREGKIFLFSGKLSKGKSNAFALEHFWLCGDCAKDWTLAMDGEHGIQLLEKKRRQFRAKLIPVSTPA